MKSIVYILIAVFAGSILFTALPNTSTKQKQSITIQCIDDQFTADQLEKSAKIIEARIADYGFKNAKANPDSESGTIQVVLNTSENSRDLGFLLLSKGNIEFYETYNRKEVVNAIETSAELMKILDIPKDDKSPEAYSSIIGFCQPNNKEVASQVLNKTAEKYGMTVKFLWSGVPYSEGQFVLHMLKKDAAINKSYIKSTSVMQDSRSKAYQLNINFNSKGTELWSDITSRNIGKNITIALDNRVLSSPRVMAQIKGGRAMITGNFSENDLKLISVLANNENLPLEFKIQQ